MRESLGKSEFCNVAAQINGEPCLYATTFANFNTFKSKTKKPISNNVTRVGTGNKCRTYHVYTVTSSFNESSL